MSSNTIPCRKAFSRKLQELAEADKNIMVVTSDARGSVTLNEFAIALPEQFVEVGIAEQNEVGLAAGMATFGKNVFVCAPACFLSARSLEQIKVDVVYSRTNVKIVGISGGVSYGALGFSHHSLHDLAVMRTFPGLVILLPSDRYQTEAMTEWMAQTDMPVYIRMGRGAVPDVYTADSRCFEFGKANLLRQGDAATIIASGEMVSIAMNGAELLAKEDISIRVLDMHTIKPLDYAAVITAAIETGAVMTIEEHSIYGGLGGAVAEILAQEHMVPMRLLGIPDEIPVEGESQEVFDYYHLTPKHIAAELKKLIARKILQQGV